MWKAHRQQSNWGEVHFSLEPSSGRWRSRNHSLHRGKTRDEQAQLGDCGRRMPHPIPCGYQTHQEQRIHIPSAGSKQIRPWCACWIRAHCCQKLLQWVLTLKQLASGSVMGSGDGVGRGQTVIEIVIFVQFWSAFYSHKNINSDSISTWHTWRSWGWQRAHHHSVDETWIWRWQWHQQLLGRQTWEEEPALDACEQGPRGVRYQAEGDWPDGRLWLPVPGDCSKCCW